MSRHNAEINTRAFKLKNRENSEGLARRTRQICHDPSLGFPIRERAVWIWVSFTLNRIVTVYIFVMDVHYCAKHRRSKHPILIQRLKMEGRDGVLKYKMHASPHCRTVSQNENGREGFQARAPPTRHPRHRKSVSIRASNVATRAPKWRASLSSRKQTQHTPARVKGFFCVFAGVKGFY